MNTKTSDTRTPVEELRSAAERIREFAEGATPSNGDGTGWFGTVNTDTGAAFIYGGPVKDGYRTGTVFEFKDELDCEECHRPSPADLNWMWLMSPALAEPLAEWLLSCAAHVGKVVNPRSQEAIADKHAIAVARAINGTAR